MKTKCVFCKRKLVAESKSGTSHLKDHYKSCLKRKLVDKGQKFLTPSLMMGTGKNSTLQAYAFDPDHARKQLAYMIIMHECPLNIVEHLGFRRFCHALQPLFHVVSRNTIKSDILKIYDVERVKTMKLMEKNQSRISITTNMWTASNQKRGFMVITTHYIDDYWKLQSRILRFVYVSCPHTAKVLCKVLMSTFLEWNIDRKLSTLTVDNCTTNDAMISLLLKKFGESGHHVWYTSFFHVRCSAHIINLIVKDGLDVIKSSIEKVRDSVVFWTATPKRKEKFIDAARQLGIYCGKKLSLDCPTRWNSTYLMLLTAIHYMKAFGRLRLKDHQYKCCPSDDDWNFSIDICERLKVFYEVTLLFSGTSYPTSNLFFSNVCDIKVKLSQWVCCGNDVVEEMAYKMIEKYDKYWENSYGFLGVAVVLDPRYKMSLIEYYFKQIYGNLGVAMENQIRKHCYDLLTLYEGKNMNGGESSRKPLSTSDGKNISGYKLFKNEKKKGKTSHVKSDLDRYLEEDELPSSDDDQFDILAWWKTNGCKYLTLQAIARDLLAVPVSTVASESSFSTGGRVVSPNRNRLHSKTLEALMCTQSWLAALENGGEATVLGKPFPTINDDSIDSDECISDVTCLD